MHAAFGAGSKRSRCVLEKLFHEAEAATGLVGRALDSQLRANHFHCNTKQPRPLERGARRR